jgi:hypothetical protein
VTPDQVESIESSAFAGARTHWQEGELADGLQAVQRSRCAAGFDLFGRAAEDDEFSDEVVNCAGAWWRCAAAGWRQPSMTWIDEASADATAVLERRLAGGCSLSSTSARCRTRMTDANLKPNSMGRTRAGEPQPAR